MYNSKLELFSYLSLRIGISTFITCLGFVLVDCPLRLDIDGPYILSELLLSAIDMGQFYIMFVDTI